MDFGRLPRVDGVDFRLPPLAERSLALLRRAARPTEADWLRVGAPAWSRRSWVGSLYPAGTPASGYLRAYAAKLPAIELDATGHALPDETRVSRWRDETPETFRFLPKLPLAITHGAALVGVEREMEDVAARFAPLGPRLGPVLVQLAPWFGFDRLGVLERFLARLPAGLRVAVEARHESWFDFGALAPELADVLARHSAIAVITDTAGRRDVCHGTLTAPEVLVRFAGNAPHESDERRLDAWAERLVAWRASGLTAAYFFVHQPDEDHTPRNLAHLLERARAHGADVLPLALGGAAAGQLRLF